MEDLGKVLNLNLAKYQKHDIKMPVLKEFVMGYLWTKL